MLRCTVSLFMLLFTVLSAGAQAGGCHVAAERYVVLPLGDMGRSLFQLNVSPSPVAPGAIDRAECLLERVHRLSAAHDTAFLDSLKRSDAFSMAEIADVDLAHGVRQYVGATNAEGHALLYINGLCHEFGDWRNALVGVDDGGPCFFQSVVDLTTKRILWISVNGIG